MYVLLRHKRGGDYLALVRAGWGKDVPDECNFFVHFTRRNASTFESVAEAKHWLKHFRLRQKDYEFEQVEA